MYFFKKEVRIILLKSITRLKIPVYKSQHKSYHMVVFFIVSQNTFRRKQYTFSGVWINHSRFQDMFVHMMKCIACDGNYFVTNNKKYDQTTSVCEPVRIPSACQIDLWNILKKGYSIMYVYIYKYGGCLNLLAISHPCIFNPQ